MTTTTNLAEFGSRELGIARDLLNAMFRHGLPSDFTDNGVHIVFNTDSGYVFLSNSEHAVAMLNGGKLESFYSSPYDGIEGTFDELTSTYTDMCTEDQEWFREVAKVLGRLDELPVVNENGDPVDFDAATSRMEPSMAKISKSTNTGR